MWRFVYFFFRKAPDISSLPSSSDLSEEVTSETHLKDLTVTDMQTYTCAISDVTPASGSAKFILKQTSGTSGLLNNNMIKSSLFCLTMKKTSMLRPFLFFFQFIPYFLRRIQTCRILLYHNTRSMSRVPISTV